MEAGALMLATRPAARPSLTEGRSFLEEVEEVLSERLPLYRAAADCEIDTDRLTAAGVAAQEPTSDSGSEPQRQEIPEAGIAVTFPGDWSVVVQMIREETILPPELSDADPVDLWVVVDAAASDGRACSILRYGEHPLGLDDHAAWFESSLAEEPDVTSVVSAPVTLPLGDAIRIDAFPHLVYEDPGREYTLLPVWSTRWCFRTASTMVRPCPMVNERGFSQ